jgi:DNA uptake protein ComE-like DNA-binding protein
MRVPTKKRTQRFKVRRLSAPEISIVRPGVRETPTSEVDVRIGNKLLVICVFMMSCAPEPVALLPLPPEMEYPWMRVRSSQLQVERSIQIALARAAVHDAALLAAMAAVEGDRAVVHERTRRVGSTSGADAGSAASTPTSSGGSVPPAGIRVVDLNTATMAELDTLPRVGPAMAQRIVDARPFAQASELRRVRGVGEATWRQLEPWVRVGSEPAAVEGSAGP